MEDNPSAFLVVSAAIIPGKEEEFNLWYDKQHIPLYASKKKQCCGGAVGKSSQRHGLT